jgi:hypothetical protein
MHRNQRYGIVCGMALMIVLMPIISSAQTRRPQAIIDAPRALDTAEDDAAVGPNPAQHQRRQRSPGSTAIARTGAQLPQALG